MEVLNEIHYSANNLGAWNCLACGAIVFNIALHNKFHAEFYKDKRKDV